MKISTMVVALLFMIAAIVGIFGFVGNLYAEENYNVDLTSDPSTIGLSSINDIAISQKTEVDSTNSELFNGTVGQPGAQITGGDISQGDLLAASGRAIASTPAYLGSFFSIVTSMASITGLSGTSAFWFLITSLFFLITTALIGMFLYKNL